MEPYYYGRSHESSLLGGEVTVFEFARQVYDLKLTNTASDLYKKKGPNSVIVAFVDDKLHICIFDADEKQVINKVEGEFELMSEEMRLTLKNLKEELRSSLDESELSDEKKQKIIQYATSIVGRTPEQDTTVESEVLQSHFDVIWNSYSIPIDKYEESDEKLGFDKNLTDLLEELRLSNPSSE